MFNSGRRTIPKEKLCEILAKHPYTAIDPDSRSTESIQNLDHLAKSCWNTVNVGAVLKCITSQPYHSFFYHSPESLELLSPFGQVVSELGKAYSK